MKEDLRMNAKSPDPDDLAREEPPEPNAYDTDPRREHPHERAQQDRSAPHVPPLEKGKIKGE
jgi:hypothetical protein